MSTASIPESSLAAGFTPEVFEEFLQTRDEPEWVTQARRDAFELYQEKLAEPLDQEEWKRVDLRAFRPGKFQLRDDSFDAGNLGTLMLDRADFAGSVVHVDSHYARGSASEELKVRGVLFGDLATMLREHGDTLRPHFATRAVQAGTDRFSAWHAAFWTGGTVLYVPTGVTIDEPLYSFLGLAQAGATYFSNTIFFL
jgi:Fe-S cluster assembly protein SufD